MDAQQCPEHAARRARPLWRAVFGLLRRKRGRWPWRLAAQNRGAEPQWKAHLGDVSAPPDLEAFVRELVRVGIADVACVAQYVGPGRGASPQSLVLRQVAARAGLPDPPWPGDLLLLPGRGDLIRQLRGGLPVRLGMKQADVGTAFAWSGSATCGQAVLLPLRRATEWYGCLALLARSDLPFAGDRMPQLLTMADALSDALDREA